MQESNSTNPFLPWYNFPLINFLNQYLQPSMNIFEFGTGTSTLFYASHHCNVYGVETSIEWLEKIQNLSKTHNLTEKISIEFCTKPHTIETYLTKISHNIKLNIIIIDSYNRINCLKEAKKLYNSQQFHGITILDNSERKNIQNAKEIMQEFAHIHFKGTGPNRNEESESLVFFQKNHKIPLAFSSNIL